ncbi:hypothetical protein ES695_00535 [Candidatus Atribacteria bacterium 1244-E10-H5-B2]|nr:MAG: hypothetical protein ES695_00535 [Candidatus Atribacteria bacterium 1244-E10-H5-B2]
MKAEDALEFAKHNISECFLCGDKEIITIGCFIPHDPENRVDWLMGKLPKGKMRTAWYGLCKKCFNLPNKEKLIEEKIENNAKLKTGYSIKSINGENNNGQKEEEI